MREAFGLPARLTVSTRGADALATELAAAAIHAADPPSLIQDGKDILQHWGWIEGKRRCITLTDIVLPVLDDLIATALKEGAGQMDAAAQERLIAEMRTRLEGMSEPDKQHLLNMIGAKDFNDTAIRNMLLTGGGLAAINIGVGAAGFSAYILAAQASAFIPMVSGPALVSLVSVISNPVTMIVGTAAAIWWVTSSAKQKIQTAVGLRVLALLALQASAPAPAMASWSLWIVPDSSPRTSKLDSSLAQQSGPPRRKRRLFFVYTLRSRFGASGHSKGP